MSNPREVTVREMAYRKDGEDWRIIFASGVEPLAELSVYRFLDALLAMQAERDEARSQVDFTYCAYCGESFPLDDDAATQVGEHIKTCLKHPMRRVEDERDEARELVFEMFRQDCLDCLTDEDTYDHGYISAYEDAQAALIEWGVIKAEQCRRTT